MAVYSGHLTSKAKPRRPSPKTFTMSNVMKILLIIFAILSFSTILLFLVVLQGAELNSDAPSLSIRALRQAHKIHVGLYERLYHPVDPCIDAKLDLELDAEYTLPLNLNITLSLPLGPPLLQHQLYSGNIPNKDIPNTETLSSAQTKPANHVKFNNGSNILSQNHHRILQRSYGRRFELDVVHKFESWSSGSSVCRRWITNIRERALEMKKNSTVLSLKYAFSNPLELKREGWNKSESLEYALLNDEPASMAISFWAKKKPSAFPNQNLGSEKSHASLSEKLNDVMLKEREERLTLDHSEFRKNDHSRSLKAWFSTQSNEKEEEEDSLERIKRKVNEVFQNLKTKSSENHGVNKEDEFENLLSVRSLPKSPLEQIQTSNNLFALIPPKSEYVSVELCTSASVPLLMDPLPSNGLGLKLSFMHLKKKKDSNLSFSEARNPLHGNKEERKRECKFLGENMLYLVAGGQKWITHSNLNFSILHPFPSADFALKWETNCNTARQAVLLCLLLDDDTHCQNAKMESCMTERNSKDCKFILNDFAFEFENTKEENRKKRNDNTTKQNHKGTKFLNKRNDKRNDKRRMDAKSQKNESIRFNNDGASAYIVSNVASFQISSSHFVHTVHLPPLPPGKYKYLVSSGDKLSSVHHFRVWKTSTLPILKHLDKASMDKASYAEEEAKAKVNAYSFKGKDVSSKRKSNLDVKSRGRLSRAEVRLGRKGPLTRKAYQRGPVGMSLLDFNGHDFIHMAFISDSQYGSTVFRRHLSHVRSHKPPPDVFVHVGDRVQRHSSENEWAKYWSFPLVEKAISQTIPHMGVYGNHDHALGQDHSFLGMAEAFSPLAEKEGWYSVTIGDCLVIGLNSNLDPKTHPVQTIWLRETLASVGEARKKGLAPFFILVLVHIAPFVDYWDPPKEWKEGMKHVGEHVRLDWVPLFEKFKVDMVVSGHTHVYQRGERNGVVYVIVGGGGGAVDKKRVEDWSMYKKTFLGHHYMWLDVSSVAMSLTVYDLANNPVDHVIFEPDDFFLE